MADKRKRLRKALKSTSNRYHDTMASGPEAYGYSPADTSSLDKEYEQYLMDRDSIGSEERKEGRAVRRKAKLVNALGKAADAIGKIGAAKAGGLVSGDLVGDMSGALDSELDSVSDKYDTKRLSLSQKGRELKKKSEELDLADKAALKAAKEARKAEIASIRKERAELEAEDRALAEKEKIQTKLAKIKEKTENKIEKATDKLADAIEADELDGAEVVEELKAAGLSDEVIAPFKETVKGFLENEDEKAQAKLLTSDEFRQVLVRQMVKNRLEEDVRRGLPVAPAMLEAFGIENKDLTPETKDDKVKASPEKAAVGETKSEVADGNPNTFPYEMTYINKVGKKVTRPIGELTPERVEDMRDNYRQKEMDVVIQRIK